MEFCRILRNSLGQPCAVPCCLNGLDRTTFLEATFASRNTKGPPILLEAAYFQDATRVTRIFLPRIPSKGKGEVCVRSRAIPEARDLDKVHRFHSSTTPLQLFPGTVFACLSVRVRPPLERCTALPSQYWQVQIRPRAPTPGFRSAGNRAWSIGSDYEESPRLTKFRPRRLCTCRRVTVPTCRNGGMLTSGNLRKSQLDLITACDFCGSPYCTLYRSQNVSDVHGVCTIRSSTLVHIDKTQSLSH